MTMLGGVGAALVASVITLWLVRRLARHVSIPFDEYIAKRCEAGHRTGPMVASTANRLQQPGSVRVARSVRHLPVQRATTTHSRGMAMQDIIRLSRTTPLQIRISLN